MISEKAVEAAARALANETAGRGESFGWMRLDHQQRVYRMDDARAALAAAIATLNHEGYVIVHASLVNASPPVHSLHDGGADDLRAKGWAVAVHNDYRIAGECRTFWLLTHPNGRWLKGEGHTDAEALAQIRALIVEKDGMKS